MDEPSDVAPRAHMPGAHHADPRAELPRSACEGDPLEYNVLAYAEVIAVDEMHPGDCALLAKVKGALLGTYRVVGRKMQVVAVSEEHGTTIMCPHVFSCACHTDNVDYVGTRRGEELDADDGRTYPNYLRPFGTTALGLETMLFDSVPLSDILWSHSKDFTKKWPVETHGLDFINTSYPVPPDFAPWVLNRPGLDRVIEEMATKAAPRGVVEDLLLEGDLLIAVRNDVFEFANANRAGCGIPPVPLEPAREEAGPSVDRPVATVATAERAMATAGGASERGAVHGGTSEEAPLVAFAATGRQTAQLQGLTAGGQDGRRGRKRVASAGGPGRGGRGRRVRQMHVAQPNGTQAIPVVLYPLHQGAPWLGQVQSHQMAPQPQPPEVGLPSGEAQGPSHTAPADGRLVMPVPDHGSLACLTGPPAEAGIVVPAGGPAVGHPPLADDFLDQVCRYQVATPPHQLSMGLGSGLAESSPGFEQREPGGTVLRVGKPGSDQGASGLSAGGGVVPQPGEPHGRNLVSASDAVAVDAIAEDASSYIGAIFARMKDTMEAMANEGATQAQAAVARIAEDFKSKQQTHERAVAKLRRQLEGAKETAQQEQQRAAERERVLQERLAAAERAVQAADETVEKERVLMEQLVAAAKAAHEKELAEMRQAHEKQLVEVKSAHETQLAERLAAQLAEQQEARVMELAVERKRVDRLKTILETATKALEDIPNDVE